MAIDRRTQTDQPRGSPDQSDKGTDRGDGRDTQPVRPAPAGRPRHDVRRRLY
jgi:hypothetical protein